MIKCVECGRDMDDEQKTLIRSPCPDCGSLKRHFYVKIDLKTTISCSISSKFSDNTGFVKVEERCRDNISNRTGRPVKTTILIDRREPNITSKYHKVEELDEEGIFFEQYMNIRIFQPQNIGRKKKSVKFSICNNLNNHDIKEYQKYE